MQSLYPPSTAAHGGGLAHLAGDPGTLASVQQQMTPPTTTSNASYPPPSGASANPMPPALRLSSPSRGVNPQNGRATRKRKTPPPGQPTGAPTPPPPPSAQHPQGGASVSAGGGIAPSQTQHLPILHAPPAHFTNYPPPSDYSALPPPPAASATVANGLNGEHKLSQPSVSQESGGDGGGPKGRALSQSKRAEQNRKAQRAFRERRDQHVKNLESRSQLLEAALSSADEANRRWEECRSVVDTLRIENTQLRAEIAGLRAENASLHAALTNSGASYAQQQQIMHEAAAAAKEIVDVNGTGNGQEGEVNKAR